MAYLTELQQPQRTKTRLPNATTNPNPTSYGSTRLWLVTILLALTPGYVSAKMVVKKEDQGGIEDALDILT